MSRFQFAGIVIAILIAGWLAGGGSVGRLVSSGSGAGSGAAANSEDMAACSAKCRAMQCSSSDTAGVMQLCQMNITACFSQCQRIGQPPPTEDEIREAEDSQQAWDSAYQKCVDDCGARGCATEFGLTATDCRLTCEGQCLQSTR